MKFDDLILRWTVGSQNTLRLDDYDQIKVYQDFLWLAKLSIRSFQRFFPEARLVVLYNGNDFNLFLDLWSEIPFSTDAEFINQIDMLETGEMKNSYHFHPRGVWWKWLPFRLDENKHEICVDTDIICINKPTTWYQWIEGSDPLIITPERFETVVVNTCGDFAKHPLLVGKKPFNCGVVGQRKGYNFEDRFFEITKAVNFGNTHDSLFITEQGAINLWLRTLEVDGYPLFVLDFAKNAWMRDFLFFLQKGVQVETIHAVTWHKRIAKHLQSIFEQKVMDESYSDKAFIHDLVKNAAALDEISKFVFSEQMEGSLGSSVEFLLPK